MSVIGAISRTRDVCSLLVLFRLCVQNIFACVCVLMFIFFSTHAHNMIGHLFHVDTQTHIPLYHTHPDARAHTHTHTHNLSHTLIHTLAHTHAHCLSICLSPSISFSASFDCELIPSCSCLVFYSTYEHAYACTYMCCVCMRVCAVGSEYVDLEASLGRSSTSCNKCSLTCGRPARSSRGR